MSGLCPDLLLLAAVAQAYGLADGAQSLYLLAQLGTPPQCAMTAGDMQAGLGLLGVPCAHIVAARDKAPTLVATALAEGHIVLAQYRERLHPRLARWAAVCEVSGHDWRGVATTEGWHSQSVGSSLGGLLTGHFLIVTEVLPSWYAELMESVPQPN